LADDKIQGYLKISPSILKEKFRKKINDLYILKAIGYSMNRANINDNNIEQGDYLIIDKSQNIPENNDYVVSVIDGAANIKKFYADKINQRIILKSESTNDFAPIYIHANDLKQYAICGKVIEVLKEPDDFKSWENAGLSDTLKALGPMSNEEHSYYMNL
jgi:SOS-response transcriptional repressor LexA